MFKTNQYLFETFFLYVENSVNTTIYRIFNIQLPTELQITKKVIKYFNFVDCICCYLSLYVYTLMYTTKIHN